MIKLENKLYSSTEVAEILGVSLRSVYRYLEEDKLTAEVKTATGRHRFTRQNIIDFLYPKGIPEEEKAKIIAQEKTDEDDEPEIEEDEEEIKPAPKAEVHVKEEPKKEEPKVEVSEEESVDWLSKFREAAKKFEDEPEVAEKVEEVTGLASDVTEAATEGPQEMFYYRSRLGGLKDIAQNIDKTARNSGLDYAFTMNAGLSLYKPISPFSVLHAYIRSKDKDFFERILTLTPSDEGNAQLCLVVSDEDSIYKGIDELHGLKVVEKKRLVEDIGELDEKLLKEAEGIL